MKRLLIIICAFLVLPCIASAHADGPYYETIDSGYRVDVGYSSQTPALGESVLFDFQLRRADSTLISGSDTPFSDVWIKIENENMAVVLATGIHNAEFGGPRLSYVFPKEGKYRVSVRYENTTGSIATASFPLTVIAPSNEPVESGSNEKTLYGVVGVILGCLISVLVMRRKRV